jgi:hypothetical protein
MAKRMGAKTIEVKVNHLSLISNPDEIARLIVEAAGRPARRAKPWRLKMPFVTFTVRRTISAAEKSRLSEAMLEARVAAGYHQADRFHRFLEVGEDDLLVDPRYPEYATDRTDRFMVVEVVISSGRPTATAATIADEAVRIFGERLHLAPEDILFVFHEVAPNLPRFPTAPIRPERIMDA